MKLRPALSVLLTATLATATAACQTGSGRVPATLVNPDEATLSNVKQVLSEALDRAQIRLGPGDLANTTTLSVLPPPLGEHETNSPARPSLFDILTNGKDCYLVSQDTGDSYRLDGISCQPAPSE